MGIYLSGSWLKRAGFSDFSDLVDHLELEIDDLENVIYDKLRHLLISRGTQISIDLTFLTSILFNNLEDIMNDCDHFVESMIEDTTDLLNQQNFGFFPQDHRHYRKGKSLLKASRF